MKRLALATIIAMGLLGASAPIAWADGGPPISISAGGIATPSGKALLETVSDGPRTMLLRVDRGSDRVARHRTLPLAGFWIPAIGIYEPTPAGLSADGRTLVLQGTVDYSRNPKSSFAIVDAKSLRLRGELVRLHGTFGFDGLSPDGRRMYLVQYPSPLRQPTHYAVRAYDLGAARLEARPIVDPADDEQMRGFPVTRTMSPDGRWAYTLYTGAASGKAPFIHALDLGRGRAKCIDLPRSIGHVFSDHLRIAPGGRTLAVVSRRQGEVASVNLSTFEVSTPATRGAAAAGGSGGGFPWPLLALVAGLIVAAASLWGVPRLHRQPLAGADE